MQWNKPRFKMGLPASATLKLLAQKEGKKDLVREIEHTFHAKENDLGYGRFTGIEELMNPENGWYDPTTDSITLRVEINADAPTGLEIEFPSQMPENMGNLFGKGDKYSDCTLVSSDGIKFKVYKGILACQSPVFEAMFENGMVEAQNGIVEIADIHSEIMDPMLRFIYSGIKPNLEENIAGDLLIAAEKYELIRLKNFCEVKLANSLNNENVCELLVLADQNLAKILKVNAIKYIKENANEIAQTEGWKMLEQGNYGKLFGEIVKVICAKEH